MFEHDPNDQEFSLAYVFVTIFNFMQSFNSKKRIKKLIFSEVWFIINMIPFNLSWINCYLTFDLKFILESLFTSWAVQKLLAIVLAIDLQVRAMPSITICVITIYNKIVIFIPNRKAAFLIVGTFVVVFYTTPAFYASFWTVASNCPFNFVCECVGYQFYIKAHLK